MPKPTTQTDKTVTTKERVRVRFAVSKHDAPDAVIVYAFESGRYSLTGAQALAVAKKLGNTKTKSWKDGGRYVTVPPRSWSRC